jgi:antitoxin CptB
VSHLHDVSNQLQSNPSDIRRKRLLFRCWHRGTQEGDLILGWFAEASLNVLNSGQLDRFESLLDCADADLFDWIIGGRAAPEEYDHEVMYLLRAFWAQRHRQLQHNSTDPKLTTQE